VRSGLPSTRLRRILVAYTVNRLGTWFGVIALSLVVFDHTHSAIAVAGLLFAGQVLPALVVPALVAHVELSERAGELSGLYFFEGVATTTLAVLLWHFWLPAVLLLVALDGSAALTASALLRTEAARAAREEVAGDESTAVKSDSAIESSAEVAERKANAALNIAFSGTFVLGPALAGEVVGVAGGSAALFIDAASFLICGAMLIDVRPHISEAKASVRARLKEAWLHVGSVPALATLLVTEAVALVFFESGAPIQVAYTKATLQVGDRGYGLLLTVWGVGGIIGSIVFARGVRRSLGTMLTGGTLAVGVGYIGFAAAPSFGVACAAAVIGGVGNGVQWASLISAVQQLTPPALHGRIMGGVESIGAFCLALGLSLGGALVALSSPRGAFLAVGLGAVMTTIVFLRLSMQGFAPPPNGNVEPSAETPVESLEIS
jgi:predicted MFS family arabinose efflux permease